MRFVIRFDLTHGSSPASYSEEVPKEIEQLKIKSTFFSPLGYFITVKCNILFIAILAYSTYNRTSASLSRQKKSLCRTFRILLLSITRSKLRTIAII